MHGYLPTGSKKADPTRVLLCRFFSSYDRVGIATKKRYGYVEPHGIGQTRTS